MSRSYLLQVEDWRNYGFCRFVSSLCRVRSSLNFFQHSKWQPEMAVWIPPEKLHTHTHFFSSLNFLIWKKGSHRILWKSSFFYQFTSTSSFLESKRKCQRSWWRNSTDIREIIKGKVRLKILFFSFLSLDDSTWNVFETATLPRLSVGSRLTGFFPRCWMSLIYDFFCHFCLLLN